MQLELALVLEFFYDQAIMWCPLLSIAAAAGIR